MNSYQFIVSVSLCFQLSLVLVATLPLSSNVNENNGTSLCSPQNKKLRYHEASKSCHEIRKKGPCAGNMLFYQSDTNKTLGDCDCPQERGLIDTAWVYHPDTNTCYKSYQKAYCGEKEWLIFNEQLNPVCQLNPCSAEMDEAGNDSDKTVMLFKGQCVILMDNSPLCKEDEVITLAQDDVVPSCGSNLGIRNLSKTATLKCKPGSRRDVTGKCRTVISTQAAFDG